MVDSHAVHTRQVPWWIASAEAQVRVITPKFIERSSSADGPLVARKSFEIETEKWTLS